MNNYHKQFDKIGFTCPQKGKGCPQQFWTIRSLHGQQSGLSNISSGCAVPSGKCVNSLGWRKCLVLCDKNATFHSKRLILTFILLFYFLPCCYRLLRLRAHSQHWTLSPLRTPPITTELNLEDFTMTALLRSASRAQSQQWIQPWCRDSLKQRLTSLTFSQRQFDHALVPGLIHNKKLWIRPLYNMAYKDWE